MLGSHWNCSALKSAPPLPVGRAASLDSTIQSSEDTRTFSDQEKTFLGGLWIFIYLRELSRAWSVLLCDNGPNVTCEVCRYEAPKLIWNVFVFNTTASLTLGAHCTSSTMLEINSDYVPESPRQSAMTVSCLSGTCRSCFSWYWRHAAGSQRV